MALLGEGQLLARQGAGREVEERQDRRLALVEALFCQRAEKSMFVLIRLDES